MEKKLQIAEKEQKKWVEEASQLYEEVSLAKLAVISKLVDQSEMAMRQDFKKWIRSRGDEFFEKERQDLSQLIQNSPYRFEAQLVLDKILQMDQELK